MQQWAAAFTHSLVHAFMRSGVQGVAELGSLHMKLVAQRHGCNATDLTALLLQAAAGDESEALAAACTQCRLCEKWTYTANGL